MPRSLSVSAVVTDHAAYARERAAVRSRMIPIRRERRVRLGDQLLLEFENAETLLYQVQEMVHVERITDPGEVAAEVDAYSRMLPTSHELCATLFLELDDPTTIRADLARLAGIHRALSLRIGTGADTTTAPGLPLPGRDASDDEETVSVHVLRFALTDAQRDALRDPSVPVEVVVDHPAYADSAPVTGATRLSLLADLSLDPSTST